MNDTYHIRDGGIQIKYNLPQCLLSLEALWIEMSYVFEQFRYAVGGHRRQDL